MFLARLPSDVPRFVVHYSAGPPFHSMMDLDETERAALIAAGRVDLPARYLDPTYVETRLRVEAQMYEQFVDLGGRPLVRHPHYALVGRSARADRRRRPAEGGAWALPLARLPSLQASFTWGDSFRFDPTFRSRCGQQHPAAGRLHRLEDLPEMLARWGPSSDRPAWHQVEIQLWYRPRPEEFERLPDAAGAPCGARV